MMRFWTWLKLWAERKEREAWLNRYHCDQRCSHCDTWQGNCGGWRQVDRNTPDAMHDVCTCGKCGQQTTFFDAGMVSVVVDPATLQPVA